MLAGFNTNVRYKGDIYHVQTEDKGIKNPFVVTLVYKQGAIVYSIKTGYNDIISSPDLDAELREMVKRQHKSVISGLISGRLDKEAGLITEEGAESGGKCITDNRQSATHSDSAPEQELKTDGLSLNTTAETPVISLKRPSFDSSLDDIIIDNIIRKAAKG